MNKSNRTSKMVESTSTVSSAHRRDVESSLRRISGRFDVQEDNLTESRLRFVLQQVQLLAQGIDPEGPAPNREDLKRLKDSLLNIERQHDIPIHEIAKAREICDFMLRDDFGECLEIWFGKSQATDDIIWSKFQEDVAKASLGLYEHWSYATHQPKLMVALVILLDQFRRNMYRGTRAMYSCDRLCAKYVKRAFLANIQKNLTPKEMIFFLLVLTHSEDMEDQYLCMSEYTKLESTLDSNDPLRVFREVFSRHVTVISKFGRFPHRNEIVGRRTTSEEEDFLTNASFRFDLPVKKNKDGTFTFRRDGKELWKLVRESVLPSSKDEPMEKVDQAREQYYHLFGDGQSEDPSFATYDDTFQFSFLDPDSHRQAIQRQKYLRIGDKAPNFSALSTTGVINFHDYLGDSWGLLFCHPKDFTPICATELGRAAQLHDEFAKRNVKLLGLSVDEIKDHEAWIKDIEEYSHVPVKYPILEDNLRKISMKYGMLDQTSFNLEDQSGASITVRSVFIINPRKTISMILAYPVPVGRNFDEILRAIDALQTNYEHGVGTPADWVKGQPTIILPFYSDEAAAEKFGAFDKQNDYLRFCADPSTPIPENHKYPDKPLPRSPSLVTGRRKGPDATAEQVNQHDPVTLTRSPFGSFCKKFQKLWRRNARSASPKRYRYDVRSIHAAALPKS